MVFGDQGMMSPMFENPSFKKIAMGNAIEDIKEKLILQMIMITMVLQKHLKKFVIQFKSPWLSSQGAFFYKNYYNIFKKQNSCNVNSKMIDYSCITNKLSSKIQ